MNWTERSLVLQSGAALDFDYLIITASAETNFFDTPGMPEHAWPLYTLHDAI